MKHYFIKQLNGLVLGLTVIMSCLCVQVFAENRPVQTDKQNLGTETPVSLEVIQPEGYTIIGTYSPDGGMFELSPRNYEATNYKWRVDNGWEPIVDNQFFCEFSRGNADPFRGTFYVTVDFIDGNGQQMTVYREFTVE